jgi:predicted esterase
MEEEAIMKKLRVLCLHGYHGSAKILRDQMNPLTSGLDSLAEFVFIDAPSLANGDFGWWHAVQDTLSTNARRADTGLGETVYKGWPNTRDWLVSLFKNAAPFDGIFGFSQGAALAGLLVGLRSPDGKSSEHAPLAFNFAIMAGGFLANDPSLARLYASTASYEIPSIHMIGRSDSVVRSEYSRMLASKFNKPLLLEHDGGHVIAASSGIRQQVASFLERADVKGRRYAQPGRLPPRLWLSR